MRWAHQEVSALATRPAVGMNRKRPIIYMVCTSGLWSEGTREEFGFDPLFFPCSELIVGSIRVFDADFGIRG